MKKHLFPYILCTVFLPILFGGILYYLFCPTVIFVRQIDLLTGLDFHIRIHGKHVLFDFCRSYLFDFIWAFSFANALRLFFGNSRFSFLYTGIIPVILGACYELLQYSRLAGGVFDYADIIVEISGVMVSVFINFIILRRNER